MNLFDRLFDGDKSYFDIPVSSQKAYLEKLGPAVDDFDRSFKQYKGQLFFMSKAKLWLLSAISIPAVLGISVVYTICGLFLRRKRHVEAISRAQEGELFIPNSLLDKYEVDRSLWRSTKGAISVQDLPFALALMIRFFIHPLFLLKLLFKVAKYSALIRTYNPLSIIVNDEFSFTSSIMTRFCERHNVKHINVQHGEKFYYLRDSYFRFHEFYIWDEHYRQIFTSLNADPSQFIIELPASMRFDLKAHFSEQSYADYKYYLGIFNEEEIKSIVDSLRFVKAQGGTVRFRPHPNYSDLALLKKYVDEEEIESPQVNILESISSTQNVVGVYSTVLLQAFFNGQNVIIDDISFRNQYDALANLQYILIDKVEKRLSSYQ